MGSTRVTSSNSQQVQVVYKQDDETEETDSENEPSTEGTFVESTSEQIIKFKPVEPTTTTAATVQVPEPNSPYFPLITSTDESEEEIDDDQVWSLIQFYSNFAFFQLMVGALETSKATFDGVYFSLCLVSDPDVRLKTSNHMNTCFHRHN